MLPTSGGIVSTPTIRTGNSKAAVILSKLNKHLRQLEVEFISNASIKQKYIQVRKVYILT